jgi:hypothetical protein
MDGLLQITSKSSLQHQVVEIRASQIVKVWKLLNS